MDVPRSPTGNAPKVVLVGFLFFMLVLRSFFRACYNCASLLLGNPDLADFQLAHCACQSGARYLDRAIGVKPGQ